jgi:hypothetical protein
MTSDHDDHKFIQRLDEFMQGIKLPPALPEPDRFAYGVMEEIKERLRRKPASFIDMIFRPAELPVLRLVCMSVVVMLVGLFCSQTIDTLIDVHVLETQYGVQRERIPVARVSYSVDLSELQMNAEDRKTLAAYGVPSSQIVTGVVPDEIPPMLQSTLNTLLPRYHQSVERIIKSVRKQLVVG